MQLTEQQQAIIAAAKAGESFIALSRAGTGKTTILLEIVRVLEGSVFLGAFNKAIAVEIEERLKRQGLLDPRRIKVATMHSAGFQAFRKLAPKVRLEQHKTYKILDGMLPENADSRTTPLGRNMPTVKKLVSCAKQAGFGFLRDLDDEREWFQAIEHFALEDELTDDVTGTMLLDWAQEALRRSIELDFEQVDFDDMLLAPLIHGAPFQQYDSVLLDEGQDTNAVRRAQALRMLKPRGGWQQEERGQLIVAGDDKQAIYAFSGADSQALKLIAAEHGSMQWYPMTWTFRCGKRIVQNVQRLVPDFHAGPDNPPGLIREIQGLKEFLNVKPTAADAVLCRMNAPIVSLAYRLIAEGIGCRIEGKDIAQGLLQLCGRWKQVSDLHELSAKLEDFREKSEQRWIARKKPGNAQAINDRVEILQIIIGQLTAKGQLTLMDLSSELLSLFGDSKEERQKRLVLSTIHKAKGLEWDRVFFLQPEKDPRAWAKQPWQLEQEDNLEYVAETRAKRELVYLKIGKRELQDG